MLKVVITVVRCSDSFEYTRGLKHALNCFIFLRVKEHFLNAGLFTEIAGFPIFVILM